MTSLKYKVLGWIGDVFCIYLGTKYADFQETFFAEITGNQLQTFHCCRDTTMKSLEKNSGRFFS